MIVKQLTVFLENRSGRLAELTDTLSEIKVNIQALSVADTTDYGIMRMIVDDTDKAYTVLKDKGIAVKLTDVLSVTVPDIPGGLSAIIRVLNTEGIDIEYIYSYIDKEIGRACLILRVSDTETANKILGPA